MAFPPRVLRMASTEKSFHGHSSVLIVLLQNMSDDTKIMNRYFPLDVLEIVVGV